MSLNILIGAEAAPETPSGRGETAEEPLSGGLGEAWRRADVRLIQLWANAGGAAAAAASALQPAAAAIMGAGRPYADENELKDLTDALKTAGVLAFGAGEDLESADKPVFFAKNGVQIGLYAVSEHTGGAATERSAGVNPLDPLNLGDRIRDIRGSCERLIVFLRAGAEGYDYPSPQVQKICRKIAECGASLVLCSGGGSLGCYEKWDNATVVYGQGGFVSAQDGPGVLVQYEIGDYGTEKTKFVPFVRRGGVSSYPDEKEAAEILEAFERRSRRIRVQGFVEARYGGYAAENGDRLLKNIAEGLRFRMDKTLFGRRKTGRREQERREELFCAFSCESARELLAEGLKHDAV